MERKSRHHRKPRSLGGKRFVNRHKNISLVSVTLHRAWHALFLNLSAQEICAIINEVWLNPEYKFVCERREKGKRNAYKKNANNR